MACHTSMLEGARDGRVCAEDVPICPRPMKPHCAWVFEESEKALDWTVPGLAMTFANGTRNLTAENILLMFLEKGR